MAGEEPALARNSLAARAAQHDADDLGTHVLDFARTVETQGTGNVPLKAGDAEAHVLGVADSGQHQRGNAHHNTGQNDQSVAFQPVFFFHSAHS